MRFDSTVRAVAEVQFLAGLRLDKETCRIPRHSTLRGHALEALYLRAVLSIDRRIGIATSTVNLEQSLPVETELVIGVEVHAIGDTIHDVGGGTPTDGGQALKAPADPQQAIAGPTAVLERQLRSHSRHSRRHRDRNGVARGTRGVDLKLSWNRANGRSCRYIALQHEAVVQQGQCRLRHVGDQLIGTRRSWRLHIKSGSADIIEIRSQQGRLCR